MKPILIHWGSLPCFNILGFLKSMKCYTLFSGSVEVSQCPKVPNNHNLIHWPWFLHKSWERSSTLKQLFELQLALGPPELILKLVGLPPLLLPARLTMLLLSLLIIIFCLFISIKNWDEASLLNSKKNLLNSLFC